MGIFRSREPVVKDMSVDEGRKQFIEKAIATQGSADPIPTEIIGNKTPPEKLPEIQEVVRDNRKSILSGTKSNYERIITIIVKTNNKDLIIQLNDGVAEIIEKYGQDSIEDFKIEKCK